MLKDRYNRTIDYLRLSVTDRCDLRCGYCIPEGFNEFEPHENWLSFEEIARVVSTFARLGTRHFRLTGGEPLLRKGFTDLVRILSDIDGVEDLSLTTNGTQLARFAFLLKEAGIQRLNVSLDSLNRTCFEQITGRDSLDKVLNGLKAAREAGFEQIKINMVILPGQNDQDIERMIAFCMEHNHILRLIEMMPVGKAAQKLPSFTIESLLASYQDQFDLQPLTYSLGSGPARYWKSGNSSFTLGLITPLSRHFCATCNRVRLTVEGTLYMCLGQNFTFGLRSLLRGNCSDRELEEAIRHAVNLKPEKHEFLEKPDQISRTMALTGG